MIRALLLIAALAFTVASVRAEVPLYQVQFLGAGWSASGLNEVGVICGSGPVDGSLTRAGVSHDGQPFEILPLPLVVSGNRLLDLDTGELTTISLPGGNWQGVVSAAMNENNDICGYIAGYSSCSLFPVRYRQGVGWEFLGGCAQTATSATALNDDGDALQYYYMTTDGVSFVGDGYYTLGSLIAPGQEYYIQYGGVAGINNAHQIVASARQGLSGPIGAILMTPDLPMEAEAVPTPPALGVRGVPNPSAAGSSSHGD